MSRYQTSLFPVACPDLPDEFVGLVNEVKAEIRTGLARAAAFQSRSAAEIKRDFAAGTSSVVYQVEGEAKEEGGSSEAPHEVRTTLADLPDHEVEVLYVIAVHYVYRAGEVLAGFDRSVTEMHQRYLRAMASEHACTNDAGETQAMERALSLGLTLHRQVLDAFECLVFTCEVDLLCVHDLAFRLERLIAELELYGRDLPQVVERAKLHLDYGMLDNGVVAFRAAETAQAIN